MAINSALARRFQRNLLRKIAAGRRYNPVYDPSSSDFNTAGYNDLRSRTTERLRQEQYEADRNTAKFLAHGDPGLEEAIFNNLKYETDRNLYRMTDDAMRPYSDKDFIDPDDPANAAYYPQKDADPISANAEREMHEREQRKAKIKSTLLDYAPWVGGGVGLGALLGGGIGYGISGDKNKGRGTLLGGLIGAGAGGVAGGVGKYLYNKYNNQ